ncbi:MAG TPA: FAD-dependent oxidoreductase [Xanthobacteraceae bacterium]|jgi:hypothetical protein
MRVAVLGAGLQGVCVALELAARGVSVDLFDKNADCVTQASAQSEGKIHLGFVYGNDRSRRTARAMIRGALSFAPLLRRWIGSKIDEVPVSSQFHYLVHANSMSTIDEVRAHLKACRQIANEYATGRPCEYFGSDVHAPVRELSGGELAATFDTGRVHAAFQTPEIAIEPEALAAILRIYVRTIPEISLRLRTTIRGVRLVDPRIAVEFESAGTQDSEEYDHVVNALWDGRLTIDASFGIVPQRPWLWRVKHFLRVSAPGRGEALPSATIVLGPFGDIVNYGQGNFLLSWYPAGCIGRSTGISPPAWLPPDKTTAAAIRGGTQAGLAEIVPAIAEISNKNAEASELKGGVIFAWGAVDIDEHNSGLHERFEIGVTSHGRYHSVDTGKYTTAPFFAEQVVGRILTSS